MAYNYRISFYMATPIVCNQAHPLHFDGLLGWAMNILEGRRERLPRYFCDLDLPLEKEGEFTTYYKASAWHIPNSEWSKDGWIKTVIWPDKLYYKSRYAKSGAIKTGQEYLRRWKGNFQLICAPVVHFYFQGDGQKVFNLFCSLNDCLGLGACTRIGYGRVITFEIEEIEEDYSVWDEQNRPARFIPLDELKVVPEGSIIDLVPYKPPYWYTHVVKCVIPPLGRWMPHADVNEGMGNDE